MLTVERLREVLRYDKDSGIFIRIAVRQRPDLDGKTAGYVSKIGYIYVSVDGTAYLAHRLAWLYVHGNWPKYEIDHVDNVRVNNRICNLRETFELGNSGNRGPNKNNKSGYKGVFRANRNGRWTAQIKTLGKRTHLGCWDTPQEAAAAYDVAAVKTFGEFAKTNRMLGLLL